MSHKPVTWTIGSDAATESICGEQKALEFRAGCGSPHTVCHLWRDKLIRNASIYCRGWRGCQLNCGLRRADIAFRIRLSRRPLRRTGRRAACPAPVSQQARLTMFGHKKPDWEHPITCPARNPHVFRVFRRTPRRSSANDVPAWQGSVSAGRMASPVWRWRSCVTALHCTALLAKNYQLTYQSECCVRRSLTCRQAYARNIMYTSGYRSWKSAVAFIQFSLIKRNCPIRGMKLEL